MNLEKIKIISNSGKRSELNQGITEAANEYFYQGHVNNYQNKIGIQELLE